MAAIRFDPAGLLDIVVGVMLFYTESVIPVSIARTHSFFLMYKGAASMLPFLPLGMPGFIIGNAADIMSAAILFIGTPPVLGGFKVWIAGALFLKGFMGLLAFM